MRIMKVDEFEEISGLNLAEDCECQINNCEYYNSEKLGKIKIVNGKWVFINNKLFCLLE